MLTQSYRHIIQLYREMLETLNSDSGSIEDHNSQIGSEQKRFTPHSVTDPQTQGGRTALTQHRVPSFALDWVLLVKSVVFYIICHPGLESEGLGATW